MPTLRLVRQSIPSRILGTALTAWVEPGAAGAPLCVFLDGELYLEHVGAKAIVTNARKQGLLTHHRCVFISYGTMAERRAHYACNPRYSRFLAKELIPAFARTQRPTVDAASSLCRRVSDAETAAAQTRVQRLETGRVDPTVKPQQAHILIGLSLSALAAVYAATRFPHVFPITIAQSPSAWWKDEWLAKHTGKRSLRASRFWVSVGSKETDTEVSHTPALHQEASQLDSCRRLAAALRARQAKVRFSIFDGGHEMKCWKRELPDSPRWVEGTRDTQNAFN